MELRQRCVGLQSPMEDPNSGQKSGWSLCFMVDITIVHIVHGVYKPTFTSLGGTILQEKWCLAYFYISLLIILCLMINGNLKSTYNWGAPCCGNVNEISILHNVRPLLTKHHRRNMWFNQHTFGLNDMYGWFMIVKLVNITPRTTSRFYDKYIYS